jgi:hypothetical protein
MMKSLVFGLALSMFGVFVAESRAEEGGNKKPQSVAGTVSKVDGSSLTVTRKGDGGEKSTDFTLGSSAKVLVQTNEDNEVKGEGGKVRSIPKTADGKVGDLKVGQNVIVAFTEPGKAETVTVLRAPAPRKGGEGDK